MKKCQMADVFVVETYGVASYDSSWRKDVSNQCLELGSWTEYFEGLLGGENWHISFLYWHVVEGDLWNCASVRSSCSYQFWWLYHFQGQ